MICKYCGREMEWDYDDGIGLGEHSVYFCECSTSVIVDCFGEESWEEPFVDYNRRCNMKLDGTIGMMISEDYAERFRAEYLQLKIRTEALANMLKRYKEGTLHFIPSCSYEMLHTQLVYMECYKNVLEERAVVENITL